ncbi:MAG: T9SS type A sorting domain-containing protein [Bacteroidia bacterium]|nr:T9SS type A sorting domain-containing protein [Bacteroidia bacterium]
MGTDRTGTFALGNYDGISIEGASKFNIVGGYAPEEGNLVSGNIAYGIPVFGAGADENIIAGNLIGTDYSGTQAIPNTYGVLFDDGAKYNIVGGSQPGATNIISGNSGYGVFLYNLGTKGNIIKGNLIGTDFSGTSAVPNANGIVVDGAAFAHVIDSNTISGNLQQGIAIHITGSDSTIITRNFIGTDITGTLSLPNGNDGIRIAEGPKFTQIGGSLQLGNIIAHNLGNGITIGTDNDDYNRISANSIHHNTGLGIELFPPGPTINDAGDYDTGPNQGMNYPVIDSTVCSGDNVTIYGSIDTQNPQNITIELFESDNDGSGYGEGLTFLGSTTPSDIGLWSYTLFSVAQLYLCATATDEAGNTSEFSQYIYINPLSINENDKNVQINIYPNPFYEIINIDVRLIKTSNLDIKIYNSLGGEIYSMSSDYSKGMQNLHIHLPGINAGIYFMSLSINDRIYEHFKLVKILHNTE